MKLFRRIALLLWRDEGERDPWSHETSSDYSRSLLYRFKEFRHRNPNMLLRFFSWIGPALIASAATLGAVWFADYLNAGKASDQVQPNAGELLMKCVEQEDGIYRCRKVGGSDDQIISGPNNERRNEHIAPEDPTNSRDETTHWGPPPGGWASRPDADHSARLASG